MNLYLRYLRSRDSTYAQRKPYFIAVQIQSKLPLGVSILLHYFSIALVFQVQALGSSYFLSLDGIKVRVHFELPLILAFSRKGRRNKSLGAEKCIALTAIPLSAVHRLNLDKSDVT